MEDDVDICNCNTPPRSVTTVARNVVHFDQITTARTTSRRTRKTFAFAGKFQILSSTARSGATSEAKSKYARSRIQRTNQDGSEETGIKAKKPTECSNLLQPRSQLIIQPTLPPRIQAKFKSRMRKQMTRTPKKRWPKEPTS